MGRKRINETSQKRQRGSQAYTMCGFDDRIAQPEFSHVNLAAFNRACDKFLQEREPGYAALRARQYGRAMRGQGKKKSGGAGDKGSAAAKALADKAGGKKAASILWEGGEG